MVKVQVLGIRCDRCNQLHANAEQAARESGIPCQVEKICDIFQILEFDPLALPALAINGEVRSSGQILTAEAIKALLFSS